MSRRKVFVDATIIVVLHILACVAMRHCGFDHISDDDFARATIAQRFAASPSLDPSGTSWLPFPFWAVGSMLAVAGRSLEVARYASVMLASCAASIPYVAMRCVGSTRTSAGLGTLLAFAVPSSIWLGSTTVPESFAATLSAAGCVALGAGRGWAQVAFALGLMASCLSRYEAWPVGAVSCAWLLVKPLTLGSSQSTDSRLSRLWRNDAWPRWCAASLCILGPILWMAWNAHAHDGPLHFVRRVAHYKQSLGEGSDGALSALMLFPRLAFTQRPDLAVAGAVSLLALRNKHLTRRWLLPLFSAGAQLAFLAYGNLRDGSPTHHPERALFAIHMVLACFVADAAPHVIREARARLMGVGGYLALWAYSVATTSSLPAQSAAEQRSAWVAEGKEFAKVHPASLRVTPCPKSFEHFALISGFAAPERVVLLPPAAAGAACPTAQTSEISR